MVCGGGREASIPRRPEDTRPGCEVGIAGPCAVSDKRRRSPNRPRGIPKPAELPRTTSLLPEAISELGLRLTATVVVPVLGGLGSTKPVGAFATRGCRYQVV